MHKKIVTIIGATGTQGGSVVRALLEDGNYHVRGTTRSLRKTASKELISSGVEMVYVDLNDHLSLEKAFAGSYAVFAVTDFFEPFQKYGTQEAIELEVQQGINLAKAAATTPTLEHYVWSTLPNSRRISNGTHIIPHFDGKNQIDDYIKANESLRAKTTFVWFTFFAQNIRWLAYAPIPVPTAGPETYIQLQATPPSVPIKSIGDADVNIGLFVKSILSQPEKTRGKFVLAEVEDLTIGEWLEIWAKTKQKKVQYLHVEKEAYYKILPQAGEETDRMQMFWEAVKEKSWTGEDEIVTTVELGVTGLLNAAEAFERMNDWDQKPGEFWT